MKLALTIFFIISYGMVMSQGGPTLTSVDCDKLILRFDKPIEQELTILLEKEIKDEIYHVVDKIRHEDLSESNIPIYVEEEARYRATYIFDQLIPQNDKALWMDRQNRSNLLDHTCSKKRNSSQSSTAIQFEIYPNPANAVLNLVFEKQPKNWEHAVFDAQGRLLISGKNMETIDVSGLQGIYFLQVQYNDQRIIEKFTVIGK